MVYKELTFFETDGNFYLLPKENPDNKVLIINRQTGEITLEENTNEKNPCNMCAYVIKNVYGIFGSIQLIACKYLILITQVVQVGVILSEPIYRIEKVQIIPYQIGDSHLTEEQKRYNAQYLQMVTSFLQAPFFFLSYTYDLTQTLQNLYQPSNKEQFASKNLFERADHRFVWNKHLMRDFLNSKELHAFCIPIIYGFFSMHNIELNDKQFSLVLISRRSVDRAGTRLFSRGIDEHGNVSNFVQTEQIVIYEQNFKASYVQVRGSIPLHWDQRPDLRYKPTPLIASHQERHQESFDKHVRAILHPEPSGEPLFESLTMINLTNHKGHEGPLLNKFKEIFHEGSQKISQIKLEAFDFHHECRQDRWDRLSLLIENVEQHIEQFGYFSISGEDYKSQRGCFRTNCIDSLDRTNVVQSLLAKHSLERQLTHFDILKTGQRIEDFDKLYHLYRNMWADNADALSIQYAGTPALKTDFTRTGKRRLVGKIKDGVNSVTRYFKNNFEDGFRQDSIDLILGKYEVKPSEGLTAQCPLEQRSLLKIFTFPLFLILASVSFFGIVLLLPAGHFTEKLMYLLFWISIFSCGALFLFQYGHEFVDSPTLVQHNKKKQD